MTFARIHRQGNNLPCTSSILKHHVSAKVCLLGHQKCVYWERFSTINIREAERFIGHWLPKKWGKTCKSIFPKKRSLDVSLGPYSETSVSKIPLPPPKKWNDFFSDWVGLFDVCFRSSKNAKLKSTTNYPLQKSIFLGARETSQDKTPSS